MFPAVVFALLLNPADLEAKSPSPVLAIPQEVHSRVQQLIQQLGDRSFKERDRAFKELRKLGRQAAPELQKAVEQELVTEIRLRCQDLLPEALTQDFEARLSEFLADTDDKYKHDVPGWREFREATDYHPLAREVFTELLRDPAHRDLLSALGMPKGEFSQRLIARKVDLYQQVYRTVRNIDGSMTRYDPKLEDVIGLLFADIIVGDTMAQGVGVRAANPYTLMIRANIRSALLNDAKAPILKSLAEKWMDTRTTGYGLNQALQMANIMGITDKLPLAYRLIEAKGATSQNIAQAVCIIGDQGKRSDAIRLAELLDRQEQVYPAINGMSQIQLRDVSFATILRITGREPTEFGMVSRNANAAVYYYSYSFPSAEDRDQAFEELREAEPELFKKKDGPR